MLQYANEKSREKDGWKESNQEEEKVIASSLNQFFSQNTLSSRKFECWLA